MSWSRTGMATGVGASSSSSLSLQLSIEKALDDGVAATCRRDRVRMATGCETMVWGGVWVRIGTIFQPGSSVVSGLVGVSAVGGTCGCGWASGTLGVDACTLGSGASFVFVGEA